MTPDDYIKLLKAAYDYITEWGEPDVMDSYRKRTAYDDITERLDDAIDELEAQA